MELFKELGHLCYGLKIEVCKLDNPLKLDSERVRKLSSWSMMTEKQLFQRIAVGVKLEYLTLDQLVE